MTSDANISLLKLIVKNVRNLAHLYVEGARLKLTDKLTVLLSSIAFYAAIMGLGLVCLVFISIGVGHLLATTIAPHMAYLLIAAFYLVLFILAVCLKRKLFVDPIARFMSRLLVEMPEEEGAEEKESETTTQNTDEP